MPRADNRALALRLFCGGLLAAFVFGSWTGPLRDCLAHPGHESGVHGAEHAASGHVAETDTHEGPLSGSYACTCLGHCSVENAPSLAAPLPLALTFAPEAPKLLAATSARAYPARAPFDLPLARPPPAVV